MSYLLYLTADKIGQQTGGGLVTHHEFEALKTFGCCDVISREQLGSCQDPWGWDDKASMLVGDLSSPPKLCHGYAGSFGKTIRLLKYKRTDGCKVIWTVAAHDRFVSKREHEQVWGVPFNYPHLVEKYPWQRYIEGYRQADVIVCPGKVAAEIVRGYGPEFKDKRIEIIPHGCEIPDKPIAPLPKRFTVGYLGAISPDKGIPYLLQAWKKLDWQDATLLLEGKDTAQPWMKDLIAKWGGGNIICTGWVKNVSDFYNQISLYVQPSATEGFGIEVLEAMVYGRNVICSSGAGAADLVHPSWVYQYQDVDRLCHLIAQYRGQLEDKAEGWGEHNREVAKSYTWDKIRQRYIDLWEDVLK